MSIICCLSSTLVCEHCRVHIFSSSEVYVHWKLGHMGSKTRLLSQILEVMVMLLEVAFLLGSSSNLVILYVSIKSRSDLTLVSETRSQINI